MKPKRCFPFFLVLERHVEVGGGSEHLQERSQKKALLRVNFERCGRSALRPRFRHSANRGEILKAAVRRARNRRQFCMPI